MIIELPQMFPSLHEVLGISKPKKLYKYLVLERGQKNLALDDALLVYRVRWLLALAIFFWLGN